VSFSEILLPLRDGRLGPVVEDEEEDDMVFVNWQWMLWEEEGF
jgi:hypothetical protein